MMNVSNPTMLSWRRGIDGKGSIRFCSIKNIKIISELLVKNNLNKFDMNRIQKYVKAYKDKNGRLWICNPKLPIKDSIEFREIVIHLICDGSALLTKYRTSKYGSTSKDTTKEFLDKLKIFGTILKYGKYDISIYSGKVLTKGRKKYFVLHFPKAITKILVKNLKIDFRTFQSKIPKEFLDGNKKLLISILRTFLIDEGSIRDTRVYFTSANLHLLEDLRKMCDKLGYEYGKIEKKKRTFCFAISSKFMKQFFKDIMKIGPLTINYKQKRLELANKLMDLKRTQSDYDKKILNLLSQRPMNLVELSENLNIRTRAIWAYLKEMEKQKKVKVIAKMAGKGGTHIWSISS